MDSSSQSMNFASVGFWLPCYRSSFFSRATDGAVLKRSYHFSSLGHGPFADLPDGPLVETPRDTLDKQYVRLDTNIFSRLLMVLPRKGYSDAYPVFPGQYVRDTAHQRDPIALVFVARDADGLVGLKDSGAVALTLTVNLDGFYVWTVAHLGRLSMLDMQQKLRDHVFHLVGGTFSSHLSGRASDEQSRKGTSPARDGQPGKPTLMDYVRQHLGMLTFFQINTILEGLYNYNLDPTVFFRSELNAQDKYTLGNFISEITASFPYAKHGLSGQFNLDDAYVTGGGADGGQTQGVQHLYTVSDVFETLLGSTDDPPLALLQAYYRLCTYAHARAKILDQFLIRTEDITLKAMKKRIERCRRALLEELIEVTHRRDPLVQTEPPDGPADRIEGVTEAQLRGYVMLFSAKLPLIANVLVHLEDLHYESSFIVNDKVTKAQVAQESIADPDEKGSEVYGFFKSWEGLLTAIEHDVASLTDAINQARTDRMLYEQEQIHAEQETLAEIQRLNERADTSISPASSITISAISNLFALFAVVLASSSLFKNGKFNVDLSWLRQVLRADNLPAELTLVFEIGVLVGIYAVFHFGVQYFFRWAFRLVQRDLRRDAKYYYEMDVRVDAPFEQSMLRTLFDVGIDGTTFSERLRRFTSAPVRLVTAPGKKAAPQERPFAGAARNSYRVERMERSEALHKVYLDAIIKVSRTRHIRAVLVYELLFHRPAKDHDYIFKDLRVVATHADELNLDEIIMFKHAVAEQFVNPCLEEDWKLKIPESAASNPNFDSLFTMTRLLPPDATTE